MADRHECKKKKKKQWKRYSYRRFQMRGRRIEFYLLEIVLRHNAIANDVEIDAIVVFERSFPS